METGRKMFICHSSVFLLFCILNFLLLFFACSKKEKFESYFPETGEAAVYQRALETSSNLNILSVALEPGFEDLEALAYFRLGKGANIYSAYLTNGEAGENDINSEYPNYLAATRRLEAGDAIYHLGGELHFLNFPHIVAARDSTKIRENWDVETIDTKFKEMINLFKPDIVFIAPDWAANNETLRWRIFKNDLISTIETMVIGDLDTVKKSNWKVSRVVVANFEDSGFEVPVNEKHPFFDKTYVDIGMEAAQKYQSLSRQRIKREKTKSKTYSIIYPLNDTNFTTIDANLPARNSDRLSSLAAKIQKLPEELLEKNIKSSLKQVTSILDSVNIKVGSRFGMSEIDQRTLTHWKGGLEDLKCSLLGIKVNYSMDEKILTMRQLATIVVGKIEGLPDEGETNIYFGGLEDRFVINEDFQKRFPYKPNEEYRLLTPDSLSLTIPLAKYGLDKARLDKPIILYTMHHSPEKENSFIHRSTIRLKFAPKFTTEVLTPIVRAIPGEKLVLRLTNHSRDGVKDTLQVLHELVESVPGPFRLNKKEGTYLDSLLLIWKKDIPNGSSVIPISIEDLDIGYFAVRQFTTDVNPDKKFGILAAVKGSPLFATFVRLGLDYMILDLDKNLSEQLDEINVLVIDRRALTLHPEIVKNKIDFDKFIENGGHLIYLAQEADEWNDSKLWEDIKLSSSQKYDERYPLKVDSEHPFMNIPNPIFDSDWQEWLFLRAYNDVEIINNSGLDIPIKTQFEEKPLVLTKKIGNGRITYIDLALHPQFLNIHVGVFRLFSNILSI